MRVGKIGSRKRTKKEAELRQKLEETIESRVIHRTLDFGFHPDYNKLQLNQGQKVFAFLNTYKETISLVVGGGAGAYYMAGMRLEADIKNEAVLREKIEKTIDQRVCQCMFKFGFHSDYNKLQDARPCPSPEHLYESITLGIYTTVVRLSL